MRLAYSRIARSWAVSRTSSDERRSAPDGARLLTGRIWWAGCQLNAYRRRKVGSSRATDRTVAQKCILWFRVQLLYRRVRHWLRVRSLTLDLLILLKRPIISRRVSLTY